MKKPEARIGSGVSDRIRVQSVYRGPVCVSEEEVRKSNTGSRMGQKSQVPIGDRCVFSEQEVVGGRCASNGKEKTQPRTDDLSS